MNATEETPILPILPSPDAPRTKVAGVSGRVGREGIAGEPIVRVTYLNLQGQAPITADAHDTEDALKRAFSDALRDAGMEGPAEIRAAERLARSLAPQINRDYDGIGLARREA